MAEPLTYEQLLPEWRNPSLVHLAPLCGELDASLVERFPRSFVGVTPQGWLRTWGDDGLVMPAPWTDAERVLARADAVIVSEHDLPESGVERDWAQSARLLVVTRGSLGCDVYKQGEAETYHAAAFKSAREEDPTGAGDVFAAAYFWHLAQTGDWREAADWGNCVASFAVEKKGTTGVPKREEVEKRWRGGARLH
jgi:1D-myo-inositol 3-kinase